MATSEFPRCGSEKACAVAAVHRALDLLGRASIEWQNGDPRVPGPLHWRMAVVVAQRELRQALEALENPREAQTVDLQDARAGIRWFNSLTPAERGHWLEVAGSAVPAAAWAAFQDGGPQP